MQNPQESQGSSTNIPFFSFPRHHLGEEWLRKREKSKSLRIYPNRWGYKKNTSERDGVTKDVSEIGLGLVHNAGGVIISGVLEGA